MKKFTVSGATLYPKEDGRFFSVSLWKDKYYNKNWREYYVMFSKEFLFKFKTFWLVWLETSEKFPAIY